MFRQCRIVPVYALNASITRWFWWAGCRLRPLLFFKPATPVRRRPSDLGRFLRQVLCSLSLLRSVAIRVRPFPNEEFTGFCLEFNNIFALWIGFAVRRGCGRVVGCWGLEGPGFGRFIWCRPVWAISFGVSVLQFADPRFAPPLLCGLS